MHPLHLLAIGYIAGLFISGVSFDFDRGNAASTLTAALVLAFSVVLAMSRRIRGKTEGFLAALLVFTGLRRFFHHTRAPSRRDAGASPAAPHAL